VAVSITDTAGLVDLNAASPALLEWLLRGLGVAPDRVAALAAAIVDFRDEDDISSVNGAESAAYHAALLDRLRAVTTVYSRQPGVGPAVAPREVLAVAAAASGAGAGAAGRSDPARADIPSQFRIPSRARAYRVIVPVQLGDGGRFARETVVEPRRQGATGLLDARVDHPKVNDR
jgi:hypothetical protein